MSLDAHARALGAIVRRERAQSSSQDAAARFFALRVERLGPFARSRRVTGTRVVDWTVADTELLRELVLENVPHLAPRRPEALFAAVRGEFGTVGDRRLWRALAWLLDQGYVERIGSRHNSDGYRLTAAGVEALAYRRAA